jgi:hypothetical protein
MSGASHGEQGHDRKDDDMASIDYDDDDDDGVDDDDDDDDDDDEDLCIPLPFVYLARSR